MSDDSGPALSDADVVEAEAFELGEEARYERRGLLGAGGMGRVFVAQDRLLRREVALKEALTPRLSAMLAREAWITAQLEHPGIVAVYDAGTSPAGNPWYSMRLVRGRTLHACIADCDTTAERLALVPHFHDACQAIAYAHAMGIVHCDLKPANIMVGQFGETQVADWGLARPVADATPDWRRIAPGEHPSAAGTARYMSPRQARGAPPTRAADVWSLGISLRELLGEAPDRPVELQAIVHRATRPEPAERYASAGELAEDLGRWLAGRRVHAHAYTAGELLLRLLSAWRAPLTVAAVAAVALTIALALGAHRVSAERATAQRHLKSALTQQALSALEDNRRPAAEVFAAHALLLGDSPAALGVLASTAGPRPERRSREALPPLCQQWGSLSPDGTLLVCAARDRLELWERFPLRQRWHRELSRTGRPAWGDGLLIQSDEAVHRLDLEDGTERDRWIVEDILSLSDGLGMAPGRLTFLLPGMPAVTVDTCGSTRAGSAIYRGQLLADCDEMVRLYDEHGVAVRDIELGHPLSWSATAPGPDGLLIGTFQGEVTRLDVERGELSPLLPGFEGAVVQLVPVPGSAMVVALGEGGRARVWSTDVGAWVATLPGRIRHILPGSVPGEIVLMGDELETWHLPAVLRPIAVDLLSGLSQVAVSPDGEQIAYALGSGEIGLIRARDGRKMQTWQWQDRVAKGVAFVEDGLAASAMSGGVRFIDLDSGVRRPERSPVLRRLGRLKGQAWGLEYEPAIVTMADGVIRRWEGDAFPSAAAFFDGASSPSGDVAAFLSEDSSVWLFDGESFTAAGSGADLVAVGVGSGGAPLVLAERQRLCADERCVELEDAIVDVALSDSLVAVGMISGDVRLLSLEDLRTVALLRGHTSRVSSVDFGPGWLVSGSWDGTVRLWDLSVLDVSRDALIREREAAWELNLDDLLGSD